MCSTWIGFRDWVRGRTRSDWIRAALALDQLPQAPYPEPVCKEKVDAVWALSSRGGKIS